MRIGIPAAALYFGSTSMHDLLGGKPIGYKAAAPFVRWPDED